MEKDYETKRQDVLNIIDFYKKNKRRPSQNSKEKEERSLSAKLTKFQTFYRTGKGTSLPQDLITLLVNEKLITTKEEEERILYEQKKKDVLEIIEWSEKNNRRPTQSVTDEEERLIAIRLNNYQKYYRNPKNGTKLPNDLIGLLISSSLITKEDEAREIDYEKKRQEVLEIITWVNENGKTPSTISLDENEKKLAIRLSNYKQHYKGTGMGVKLPQDLINLLIHNGIIDEISTNGINESTNGTNKMIFELNGKQETYQSLSNKYGVSEQTLRRNYRRYNDIRRAIDMSLYRKKENNKIKNYTLLKKELHLSDKALDRVISVETTTKRPNNRFNKFNINNRSLHSICIENGWNYDVIRNKIINKDLSPENAILEYINDGYSIPKWWIYEKNNKLFKYIMYQHKINSNEIIRLIKEKNYSLEDAIRFECINKEGKTKGYTNYNINYLFDIQSTFKDEEYFNDIKETFALDNDEMSVINKSLDKSRLIKQDLDLFELSLVIDIWNNDEIIDYLNTIGEMNNKSLKKVFFEQATIFDEKVYDGKQAQEIKRVISSVGESFYLLEYDNNELEPKDLSMKEYILMIISRNNIGSDKVNYYINLSKKYNEAKELIEQRTKEKQIIK